MVLCVTGRTHETGDALRTVFVLVNPLPNKARRETQRKLMSVRTKTQGEISTYKHIERNQGELKTGAIGIIKSTQLEQENNHIRTLRKDRGKTKNNESKIVLHWK